MVVQAKFRVSDPGTFFRLQIMDRLAGFWLSTSLIKQVYDTYLDTRGRWLLSAGYRFRRREQPDGVLMTLTTLSQSVGAIHRWEKWETLLASDRRLAIWPESSIRTKMLELIRNERLLPLASLEQTRIVRSLLRGEQQVAEVRLDSVCHQFETNQHVHFVMEVELSTLAKEETLVEIVDDLEEQWDLWPEQVTKFELAYASVSRSAGRLVQ